MINKEIKEGLLPEVKFKEEAKRLPPFHVEVPTMNFMASPNTSISPKPSFNHPDLCSIPTYRSFTTHSAVNASMGYSINMPVSPMLRQPEFKPWMPVQYVPNISPYVYVSNFLPQMDQMNTTARPGGAVAYYDPRTGLIQFRNSTNNY